jgi:3-oxoacyl-[acyl-carrier protein] reductase
MNLEIGKNKVALVTGAASGIGQALAVAYAQAGIAVAGSYYPGDPHDPGQTLELVERAGGKCIMEAVDVGDAEQVERLARVAVDRFGRLDFAVANAGLLRQAALAEMSDAQWLRSSTSTWAA